MRWKMPKVGDTRTLRRFAFLPIECTSGEKVWLEYVTVEQEFTSWLLLEDSDYDYPDSYHEYEWITRKIAPAQ